ncbi:VPLPA-CTERM sorting domain-containing protein [Tropicimonas sp. TH_r6]|uniref:VPLPA-CTERM sorting domain-containing protein n=1 Tax=Tropicimonas sp. TH_r6 TaxID=3082085 RepID=UPI002953AFD4|nr:VPLPA-CTERM sorting domain-containing protein [Tropicimonas sp. TH_r6]MDV7143886.1 VPLPA-CTERM sorting domain-containing protein [Tropicimonas sp. TH_r6]
MKIKFLAAAVAGAIAFAAPAAAAVWNFTYTYGADVISGSFSGELGVDGNTVLGTTPISLAMNGVTHSDDIVQFRGGENLFTIDGLDQFFIMANASGTEGFAIQSSSSLYTYYDIDNGTTFANSDYDPSNWTLSAVPLPASALLLIGGLGGLAAFRRRTA